MSEADTYPIGRKFARLSRPGAFTIVGGAYLVAGGAAALTTLAVGGQHPIAIAFWADLVATLVVFGLSMAVGNSSLYDPYWSVAPPIIAAAWLAADTTGYGARQAIVLILMTVWAVRLTLNWAVGWRGLSHEDWRYVQLRTQTRGRLPWWLLSLVGIQLVPTLVVFAGMLAVWPALAGDRPLNLLDSLAIGVTASAILIEGVADVQLRRFNRRPGNRSRVADVGLWRLSRHPNYLGEIAFWWGLWLFGLAAAPSWWWTVIGPLTMVALFVFVSIPMMDRRSAQRRSGYAEYAARTPALLRLWGRPAADER